MTTGQKIKFLREELGYTVEGFANLLGVHRSSMYRYEETNVNEKRDLPLSVAIMICKKFNVSLDWLAGLSDVKHRETETGNPASDIYNTLSGEGKKELINFGNYIKEKEDLHGK